MIPVEKFKRSSLMIQSDEGSKFTNNQVQIFQR